MVSVPSIGLCPVSDISISTSLSHTSSCSANAPFETSETNVAAMSPGSPPCSTEAVALLVTFKMCLNPAACVIILMYCFVSIIIGASLNNPDTYDSPPTTSSSCFPANLVATEIGSTPSPSTSRLHMAE